MTWHIICCFKGHPVVDHSKKRDVLKVNRECAWFNSGWVEPIYSLVRLNQMVSIKFNTKQTPAAPHPCPNRGLSLPSDCGVSSVRGGSFFPSGISLLLCSSSFSLAVAQSLLLPPPSSLFLVHSSPRLPASSQPALSRSLFPVSSQILVSLGRASGIWHDWTEG